MAMNQHLARGFAEMTVSRFLEYCLQRGMVDEILAKDHAPDDVLSIKEGIQAIATQHMQSAELHKSLWKATERGGIGMTEKQALALLDAIVEEAPRAKVEIQQIGNGEHVVIVNSILIWSPQDWQANRAKILGIPAPIAG